MQILRKLINKSSASKVSVSLTWIHDLKSMDDISAIEYGTQKLNQDYKDAVFADAENLHAFFSVDEKTHTIVERITAHYINIENIGIELEERITQSVFLYHRQVFLIYLALIENLAPINQQSLALMLARAINSATQMIKWRYYTYHSAPANVWLQIGHLYLLAEQKSLLSTNLVTYKNQEPTTLSTIYIKACMLGTLESVSFKRQQIDLVDTLLSKWAAKIVIGDVYDEKKHLFYVDTTGNFPAKRIRNFKPTDTYRYWCFDSINSKVELCISAIEFNISPKQLALQAFIHNKYFLPTLEVLRTEWSRGDYKRQRRSEDRTKIAKATTTTYGFEDTCYQLKQYESIQVQRGEKYYQGEKSFDERLASHSIAKGRNETNIIYMDLGAGYSSIVDESCKGIGLRISKQANEVSLGMIIGVAVKDQKQSIIGLIRSIKPMVGNELHIGIEVLSRSAFCVDAKNNSVNAVTSLSVTDSFTTGTNFSNRTATFTCLFIPEEYGVSTQETLILPRLQYNKNDTFKINIAGNDRLIRLTEALERHENWVRVAYAEELGSQLSNKLAS